MTAHASPEIRRQKIMDYLELNGTSTSRHMLNPIGISRSALNVLLRSMIEDGEVSVRQCKAVKGSTNYYTAMSDTPADDVQMAAPRIELVPWRITHKGTDGARPLQNQGGQGAARPRTATILGLSI